MPVRWGGYRLVRAKEGIITMLIDAAALPEVFFCGREYSEQKFNAVENCCYRKLKPAKGLWASPITDTGITTWERLLYREYHSDRAKKRAAEQRQTVTPQANARIFMIAGDTDRDYLEQQYNWDWTKIAQDYDAVYIDYWGVGAMKQGMWDIESIVFFNKGCFTVQ